MVWQKICDDNKSCGDAWLPAMLRRPKPLQRLQIPVWYLTDGHISHAVVRPTQQVHVTQGLPQSVIQLVVMY